MRRVRVGALLAVALAAAGLFVYSILFARERTPFVVVSVSDYARPFASNPWALEDIESLQNDEFGLDGRTITVRDASSAWSTRERGLRGLVRQVTDAVGQSPRQNTLVIYISMHGAIDDAGRPCLIPPGSLPFQPDTWLPVAELLEAIEAMRLPDRLHKLLILDCVRERVNWRYGLLYNGFADGLPAAVESVDIPNLAIISSTGPGQKGWSTADLQGTVFGHFLRLGLAGEADLRVQGGNEDHVVSVRELHHYLERHVDHWANHNRGAAQHPLLLPVNAPDFEVARALSNTIRRRVVQNADTITPPAPNVTLGQIQALWQAVSEMEPLNPHRLDPVAWGELEQRLLRLEDLSEAGPAYADAADKLLSDLESAIAGIRDRANEMGSFPNARERWNLFSTSDEQFPSRLALHSLQLAQKFGEIDREGANNIRASLDQFQESPTREMLTKVLEELGPGADAFAVIHMLRISERYGSEATWSQPAYLSRAVSVRTLAEEICAPQDGRAAYWIRGAANLADELRRTAEDRLFTADSDDETWTATEAAYEDARMRNDVVVEALNVRDRVFAELPHLAHWVASPQYQSSAVDDEVISKVIQLIEDNRALAAAVAKSPTADATDQTSTPEFLDRSIRVGREFDLLRGLLDERYAQLLGEDQKTPDVLRKIDALLDVPLLPRQTEGVSLSPAEQRARLIEKRRLIGADLYRSFKTEPAAGSGKVDENHLAAKFDYLELIGTHWSDHPAVAILTQPAVGEDGEEVPGDEQDAEPASILSKIAKKGADVRQLLSGLNSEIRELHSTPAASFSDVRSAWSHADRMMRAAAAMTAMSPEIDPVRHLRLLDLQQLALWQCERALDDFWGRGQGDSQSFFEVAAADYLRTAELLIDPNESVRRRINELQSLLDQRRRIAESGLRTYADNILLIDEDDDVLAQVGVEAATNNAEAFPNGEAAVYIRDDEGELSPTHQPLDVPLGVGDRPAGQILDFSLPGAELVGRGPRLRAVTLFRGHAFAAPFLLNAVGGFEFSFAPLHEATASVTLRGRLRKSASIVFILDCSNSMADLVNVEVPEAETGTSQLPKLDVAKSALTGMLERFAEQGDARIGVRYYGHRVGWNTQPPNQLLRQVNYGREIPPDLQPWQDVELILPVGRFDAVAVAQVKESLETVKPWGETPLYRALAEAQQDLANEPEATEKSIVVITDGVNYQFNAASPTTRADVESGAQRVPSPIHIVGFGIPESQQQEAWQQFDSLASATGGSYTRAEEATTLVRALEELLGPSQYQFVSVDGNSSGSVPLATPAEIRLPFERPLYGVLEVDVLREPIEVYGGEALEFVISSEGRAIESAQYLRGAPEFAPLLAGSGGPATGLLAGVHRPVTEQGGVRFPLSIQHRDRRFATRPKEMWIEITPLLSGGSRGETRTFYDAHFQSSLPVPVVSWFAENWPPDAQSAELRVWCKPESTPPAQTVRLSDVADKPPTDSDDAAIAGVDGVTYQVRTKGGTVGDDPLVVGIVERHAENSPGIAALKVELRSEFVPLRVSRRFDPANQLVRHIYTFAAEHAESLRRDGVISFTTRESIQSEAWQLGEPIVAEVSGATDVLRLTAPEAAQ